MSRSFLITGLPRCRTAWMSAVATTERSICHHEPLKHMQQWQDAFGIWSDGRKAHVGISDSAMGFHLGEILDRAAPRTLIIWRPIAQVEQSLRVRGFPVVSEYCRILSRRLDAFRGHPLVASVDFDRLSNPEVVAGCLEHLLPGEYVDMDRIDDFMEQVIEVDPYEVMISAASRRADIGALLGEDVIAELRAK